MIKVGDRVRIREWDDMEKEFGNTGNRIPGHEVVSFSEDMRPFCGMQYIVTGINDNGSVELDAVETEPFMWMPYMMTSMGHVGPRLCVECKWYSHKQYALSGEDAIHTHICNHPRLICLVTGSQKQRHCMDMRDSAGDCGKVGKLWEAKDERLKYNATDA